MVSFIRAILYPKTSIIIACKDDKESRRTVKELQLFIEQYDILKPEIDDSQDNEIRFKNGSCIKVIKPEEQSSRSKRSTSLDQLMFDFEGCMLSKEQIDEVLKPFCKEREVCDCLKYDSKDEEIFFSSKERELCDCNGDKSRCSFYKK